MIIEGKFLTVPHKNIHVCCGYSLESPRQGDSNEYPQLHKNICCGYSLESPRRGDFNG